MTVDELIQALVQLRENYSDQEVGLMDCCLLAHEEDPNCCDGNYTDLVQEIDFARCTDTGKIHKSGKHEVVVIYA